MSVQYSLPLKELIENIVNPHISIEQRDLIPFFITLRKKLLLLAHSIDHTANIKERLI